MGLFGQIFNSGDAIKGTLEGAGELAKDLRTAITGDNPELAAKAMEIEAELQKAQVALNQAEASNPSVFVSGWRPALGWCFVAIIGLHYMVRPIAEWGIQLSGNFGLLPLPTFDLSEIWPVLIGMLGFGFMRTAEKFGKVQGEH